MRLTVKRVVQGNFSTLSKLLIDDKFVCYGLEDMIREDKIWGATAIPEGRYKLGLRKYGAMHSRYSKRYPALHQGMLHLLDVPNFEYIYLHTGNNIGDTSGCVLVGDAYEYDDSDFELRKSSRAYKRLYKRLLKSVLKGEAEVEIINCLVDKEDEKYYKKSKSGAADGTDGAS